MMDDVDKAIELLYELKTDEAINTANKLKALYVEIVSKNYGLVFEKHTEEIDRLLSENIPVLLEIEERRIINSEVGFNYILQGDNIASLNILLKTHKQQISVIYIDPPYNRGKNDFIYDDKFIGEEDTFRHSKWLSFMYKRLLLAKDLLKDDGVIFISIDDNEFAQLKLLLDSIFGDSNFVGSLPRITKKSGKSTISFSKNHDYVLIYSKSKSNVFVMKEHIDEGFKYTDEHVDKRGPYKLNQTLDYNTLGYVNSLDFPIQIDGRTFYPGSVNEEEFKLRKSENPKDGFRWRWSKDLVKFGIENEWIVVNEKTGRLYTKTYLKCTIKKTGKDYQIDYFSRTKPMSTLELIENKYSNDNARKELDSFKLEDKFEYPKPSSLIKRLLETYYDESAVILDFFAGSGTTGHAVLELNNDDGGNRSFILCTNNQNNICDNITYPRVQKLINDFGSNLRMYDIGFMPVKDKLYLEYADDLIVHMKDLVEFQYGFTSEKLTKYLILLDDESIKGFLDNINSYNHVEKVFIGINVLLSSESKKLILDRGIDLFIVPDYYYSDF
ncbi:MAG: site-specific DNA-methyltransferase [Firmicutes bacterium HGW-Firmicutes-20]|nr:MAG: site-specific DNA-methyltransferase [Firmicutes bacterium HGW-Firmicutes-20]